MTSFYRNTRAWRVRLIHLLLWALTLGFAAQAIADYIQAPDTDLWLLGAMAAPMFGLCALGMEWYVRNYVTALEAKPGAVVIETLSTFGRARTEVPLAEVELGGERREKLDGLGGTPSIDNTSVSLRAGSRKGLIIDTTKNAVDVAGLRKHLRGAR